MNLKTSTRQVDGVNIVDCSGRITLGEGSVILREAVKDLLAKGQTKTLQALTQRRNGVVTYGGNTALAKIDHRQRLEHVIELGGGEIDVEFLCTLNVRGVFEIADTVLVKHDPLDGQAARIAALGVGTENQSGSQQNR